MKHYTVNIHLTGIDIVNNYTGEVLLTARLGYKFYRVRDKKRVGVHRRL